MLHSLKYQEIQNCINKIKLFDKLTHWTSSDITNIQPLVDHPTVHAPILTEAQDEENRHLASGNLKLSIEKTLKYYGSVVWFLKTYK